ncbi:MAG: hypothetical protein IPI64_06680 [Chloracidobacterium sp.]|nr:hypothetical protein [Chloracidobacterium sp.]
MDENNCRSAGRRSRSLVDIKGGHTSAPRKNLEGHTIQTIPTYKQSPLILTKRIILILISVFYLHFSAFAQVDERTPPPAEENEAQILAAAFVNQYLTTRRIEPLIDQFFIKDFSKRVRYCGISSCGGSDRDFWNNDGPFILFEGDDIDYRRVYSTSIDSMFLSFLSINHLALIEKKTLEEYGKAGQKELFEALRQELKNDTKLLSLYPFGPSYDSNSPPKVGTSVRLIEERLSKYEKINAALRKLENKYRSELKQKRPNVQFNVAPKEFRINKEVENTQFFNYPKGTKMFSAWPENDDVFFIIDMIREKGKLKIVAVYPPID